MNRIPSDERYNHREGIREIPTSEAMLAAKTLCPMLDIRSVAALAGGFNNSNFVLNCGSDRYALRFFSGGMGVADREVNILKINLKNGVLVPAPREKALINGRAIVLEEFVPGTLLSTIIESKSPGLEATFASVGRELAKIHSIRFEKSGLFSPTGEIKEMPASGIQFIRDFLGGLAGKRLGQSLKNAVLDLVEKEWRSVDETFQHPVLVHCDFNPKNILISDSAGEVTGVLDWEFAIAAHPLIDFGNFFRFSEDYSEAERRSFLESYERAGGSLPTNWRRASMLLDLVSMCDFLNRKEDYPKTFRTARTIIDATLREFKTN